MIKYRQGKLRKRKGVSSVIGVLIFIGILFSSVIPLQVIISEADNMKERAKNEVRRLDEERAIESLGVYPLPNESENTFNLTLINNCEVAITINRIRINNMSPIEGEYIIDSMGTREVGPFTLVPEDGGAYDIRVVSSRGNVFTSNLGLLYYIDGMWYSESLGFRLIFPSRPAWGQRGNDWMNQVKVTILDDEDVVLYDNTTVYWAISASEMFFNIESAGTYTIKVYTLAWSWPMGQYWKIVYSQDHSITWPVGDPIIELKFVIDGDQLILA